VAELEWLRLDNAAKIFPSVSGIRQTQYFRLAVRLTEDIDPIRLQNALEAVLPAFPAFQTRLKPGFFWFSLVHEPSMPRVIPESRWPCMPLRRRFSGPHLFRVRWFGCRLAVEFHHSLTDGTGGLVFVSALTEAYLAGTTATSAEPEQFEDAFQKLHDPSLPRMPEADRAFLLPYRLAPLGVYHVTTGRLSVVATLVQAKALGLSLTEFLAASVLMAFQAAFLALPATQRRRQARPLRLTIPVNLRRMFPSRTLRNFFAVIPVEIDLRLGEYTFDETARKVHHQLQSEMDPKLMRKQVMRNLRGEEHPIGRFLPLVLKNVILNSVSGTFEARQTTNLSNLGPVPALGAQDGEHPLVRDVEFVPPPSPFGKIKVGVVSYGDTLSITFGNLTNDFTVEREFFTALRRRGLHVALESNRVFPEE